jgi:hypothetical protein
VEVIDSIVERIQARNPSLNAFVYFGFASPSRSTATPEPVFDRVLSDVLLLVRFSAQILEPGSRRDPRVVAHRRGGARESKPLEIAGSLIRPRRSWIRNPGFRLRPSRSKPGARSKVGKFKVIDNKPKSDERKERSVCRRPPSWKRQRIAQRSKEMKTRWLEASQEQKDRWLSELLAHVLSFALAPGAEPRPIFLTALRVLVEPELAL